MSNFTNTKIKDTYQRVLQIDNGEIQDGLGLPVDARIQSLESDLGFTGDLDGTATLAIGLTSGDKTIQGNLDVIGKITAIEIYAQYESASIIYSSGSTKFGDTFDDTHQFTGSVSITGSSFLYNGYNIITSNDTGSIVVNSASYALSASHAISASYALTASYVNPLIQNVIITGSLFVTQSHISTVDYIDYTILTAHPPHTEGRVHWLDDTKTLQIDTDVSNFSIEVGHQNVVRVRNTTGYNLAIGKIVYINGESGNRPTVTTASWDGDPTSATTLGFVAQQINDNQTGYVVTNGMLRGINTSTYSPGTQLYLSSSGDFTSTIPLSPKHEVRLGKIVTQAVNGTIYVDIMNGYEIGELHDVLVVSSSAGDLLVKSGSLWINTKQLTGSYGLTGSLQATSFTGSLLGTSSYSVQALSSSFALTASYIDGGFY